MWWDVAPIIIAICSIIISIYVFTVTENKRYFWSSLTLSGINLLGGWFFLISINFIIGLILFTIPLFTFIHRFYNYKNAN